VAWGVAGLRQFLKGWENNIRGEYIRNKKEILGKIQAIDIQLMENDDQICLSRERARLEQQLELIMEAEEIYWQQRGSEKWTLEGDANTGFFPPVCKWQKKEKVNLISGK